MKSVRDEIREYFVFEADMDIVLNIIEKRIDDIMDSNLPKNDNNLNINEKKNIMYYRLGLNDVKAMLKESWVIAKSVIKEYGSGKKIRED